MYRGETEATCNFYRAYILNVKFGEDFDYAFANSMSHLPYLTPDQAAIHWMVTNNFRDGKDMDHSNTEHFGIWVLYFPKLPEKSSFYVVDLTKFARKIPLKVHFFALKLHNFDFIASQISCNVQIIHPGY